MAGTRLEIHDRVIIGYILPGGEVAREVDQVAQNAWLAARAYLVAGGHVRTGRLLRGVQWARSKSTGKFSCSAQVASNARHTLWVHEGTSGPIFANGGKRLVINDSKGFVRPRQVRGQVGKPFLQHGLDTAMAGFRAGA